MSKKNKGRTRAQESSSAIERMYITMRHLFNRGFYKPMGISGETLREALLLLRPEIYGSIAEEKAELDGLLYVIDRLPQGIEECRFINLTSDEGYGNSHFEAIIPPKRRRAITAFCGGVGRVRARSRGGRCWSMCWRAGMLGSQARGWLGNGCVPACSTLTYTVMGRRYQFLWSLWSPWSSCPHGIELLLARTPSRHTVTLSHLMSGARLCQPYLTLHHTRPKRTHNQSHFGAR